MLQGNERKAGLGAFYEGIILRNCLATEDTESTEIWKQKTEKNLTLHPQSGFRKRSPFSFGF
jgi:hypothetical protein